MSLLFLRKYADLEKMRFRGAFDVDIEDITTSAIGAHKIPPLLLQPLVENAIIHGLIPQVSSGRCALEVKAQVDDRNNIIITVKDNGIGFSKSIESRRSKAPANPEGHNSSGMTLVTDRISGLNESMKSNKNQFHIEDILNNTGEVCGTLVTIQLA